MVHHLLPVQHFHIIFTIPQELRDWFYYNQRSCYNLLFRVTWETISSVASIAGEGVTGMVSTLHTWGSNLSYHPHVHCIVPSGYFEKGIWRKKTSNFYCPSKELRERYKELFLKRFVELVESGGEGKDTFTWQSINVEEEESLFGKLQKDVKDASRKKWTVRIEKPVLGVAQIIEYLARYVKRVAITNARIESISASHVAINYKQYHLQKKGEAAPKGTIEFEGAKFIQRFAQHIPPRGFHKVRYYGCYAYSSKKLKAKIYTSLTQQSPSPYKAPSTKSLLKKLLGHDPEVCSNCGSIGRLVTKLLTSENRSGYHLTRSYKSYKMNQARAGPHSKRKKEDE